MIVPLLDFLDADALACARGGRLVFQGLSLRAHAGDIVAIEGPNGSGKTSLLRVLAGLLVPSEGTVCLRAAHREYRDPEERRELVGWLGHQEGVRSQLTAAENLQFFARLYGLVLDCARLLGEVGLTSAADLPCQYLSAGQKRRLALARLQLLTRPLWLLDEPFSVLDSRGRDLVREYLQQHARSGGISILATHDPVGIPCSRLALG